MTGYDIPRLLTGSFGVLAVITSVTLKIQPLPEQEVTLLLTGLNDVEAILVMADALKAAVGHQCRRPFGRKVLTPDHRAPPGGIRALHHRTQARAG